MQKSFSPLFRHKQYTAIIGRLLIAYGEIEFDLTHCLGCVLGSAFKAFKILYSSRGETQKIVTSDAIMQPFYHKAKIAEYDKIIEGVYHCVGIRNQYAHCNWNGRGRGLVFTNFEWIAREKSPPKNITKRKVNLALLKQQEAYFAYVQRGLMYLQAEYQKWEGKEPIHDAPAPQEVPKPPKYIGEGKQENPNKKKARKQGPKGKPRAAPKRAHSR